MPNGTKFYTADTHFSHALMLSSTASNRPFADVRDMDESLIRAWNNVVKPDDVVYHLGDFSMGLHDDDRVRGIFSRLMGRKFLILGNHDYQRQNRIHPVIAALGWDQPPTQQMEITDDSQRISSVIPVPYVARDPERRLAFLRPCSWRDAPLSPLQGRWG